jgi:ATPase subunit of ABC transporter with duplicated ATPase domains
MVAFVKGVDTAIANKTKKRDSTHPEAPTHPGNVPAKSTRSLQKIKVVDTVEEEEVEEVDSEAEREAKREEEERMKKLKRERRAKREKANAERKAHLAEMRRLHRRAFRLEDDPDVDRPTQLRQSIILVPPAKPLSRNSSSGSTGRVSRASSRMTDITFDLKLSSGSGTAVSL